MGKPLIKNIIPAAFAILLAACSAPAAAVTPHILPTPTPAAAAPAATPTQAWDQTIAGQTSVNFQDGNTVLYTYYAPSNPHKAHLCLWQEGQGTRPVQLDLGTAGQITGAVRTGDGKWLVYSLLLWEQQQPELWALDLDSGELKLLLAAEDLEAIKGSLSRAVPLQMLPHASRGVILFNTGEMGYSGKNADDLWKLDIDNGKLTNVLPAGKGGMLTLSPDGNFLAVIGVDGVSLLKMEGFEYTPAFNYLPISAYTGDRGIYPHPQWYPDSRGFLIAVSSPLPREENASITVRRVLVSGEVEELLTISSGPRFARRVFFSPDMDWAAYSSLHTPENNAKELHIVNLSTGEKKIIPAEGEGIRILNWLEDNSGVVFQDGSKTFLGDTAGNTQAYKLPQPRQTPQPWQENCRPGGE